MKKYLSVFLLVCMVLTSSTLYTPAAQAANTQAFGLEVKEAFNEGALVLDVSYDSLLREPLRDLGSGFFVQGDMLIEPDDIIIGINEIEIKSLQELVDGWKNCKIGSEVEFRYIHNGSESSVTINKSKADIGITISNTSYGVTVVSVSSPTVSEAGIEEGDLIIGVDEKTILNPEDLTEILKKCLLKDEIRVDYIHEGQNTVTMMPLDIRSDNSFLAGTNITISEKKSSSVKSTVEPKISNKYASKYSSADSAVETDNSKKYSSVSSYAEPKIFTNNTSGNIGKAPSYSFLEGYWVSRNGMHTFEMKKDHSYITTVPVVPRCGDTYELVDGVILSYYASTPSKVTNNLKIKVVSDTEIEIYSYQTKDTYTLFKRR